MKDGRRDEIIKLLAENKKVKVAHLAEKFQVSMETIRRDLNELEEIKMIRRVRGGAVLNNQYGVVPDYTNRIMENSNEKILIGKKAAEFVKDGDCIFIDSGATTIELSRFLKKKKNLTVFTNSMRIALELEREKDILVIIVGGRVRSGEGIISGCWAEQLVEGIYVDKLFLGVDGILPEQGIMHFNMEEGNLRRQMVKHAKQVFALADYSKFGRKALYRICEPQEIDYIITDNKADKEILKKFRNMETKVVIT